MSRTFKDDGGIFEHAELKVSLVWLQSCREIWSEDNGLERNSSIGGHWIHRREHSAEGEETS